MRGRLLYASGSQTLSVHQNHLEDLLEHRLLTTPPHKSFLILKVWGGAQEFAI